MELILFAMISLIVIVGVLVSRLNDNSFPFPFDRKTALFTPAEKNFQNLVEQAMGSRYRIINRVKLADIVSIRNGVSNRAGQTATNNANSKYLDFVICERDSMKLLGVIDLVDTQGKGYKIKKDWFVSGTLEAAAIPHIRIKVKANYTIDEIRSCINSRILGNNAPTQAPKVKGRIIPAPLVKARPKPSGVFTSSAAQAMLAKDTPAMARQVSSAQVAALPH
ncbi:MULTISPECIES: DUF2726 domain-containing protein [unclassified Colwellia]|uniref:DUF2726 domain-containing protein n=1 Tax=unclassified Colwellia TaxID=196834 RepID=UPI0015F765A8|nr:MULTISPECIES: DUF2726 domain-containing protein [unclassified Colwellia]MBA6223645.1 DUF2726 domain-containing protein [Colwellia sp. MB3u-45]MBA6267289.1 DUF2726 domain-containing protein [Colwellia sp. MB3u-43]MBA6288348.1 DUF2726 domain-containing protein [Colwellia sp. MB3u-4]MBA6297716.1 DUF2726 domain-containing protein [Colwellia sp. MB02u-9]MBA6319826.1 DUF2726 domain-containing protein [Colwellia sp. MB02u-19]